MSAVTARHQQPYSSRPISGDIPRLRPVLNRHVLPDLRTSEATKTFLYQLDDESRSRLSTELKEIESELQKLEKPSNLTAKQWGEVILFHGFPFIAFGFLDNVIMIVAGEYIDVTLGVALGISTMAAAALGNLISDVAGVGLTGYVEMVVSHIGIHAPSITPEQAMLWQTRWAIGIGRSIGIALGCLIGMFPLLFFKEEEEKKESTDDTNTDSLSTGSVATSQSTQSETSKAAS